MYNQAQVKLVLNPQDKNNERMVRIQTTFNRYSKWYATPCKTKLTKEEFNNPKLKKTKIVLEETQYAFDVAKQICAELGLGFTDTEFALRYRSIVFGHGAAAPVSSSLDDVLAAYFREHPTKPNTQMSYESAVKWVKRLNANAVITDITPAFVKELRAFMIETHQKETGAPMSPNTLGMYFRGLKAICNYARKRNLTSELPFLDVKIIQVPRQKKAVAVDDWKKFITYKPTKPNEVFAHDFARLNFAICGANLADIFSLQNKNIVNGVIVFTRQKTDRVGTTVELPLPKVAIELLSKYGCINAKKPQSYILPYYDGLTTEKQKDFKRKDIIKKINAGIKSICEALGIEPFTTYQIRHTFASYGVDGGLKAEQLRLLLGHKNISTTQIYLESITTSLQTKTANLIEEMLKTDSEV